ncbi:MAG TPA: hypothetical protein VGE69_16365 [Pseudomonadales bacterium]
MQNSLKVCCFVLVLACAACESITVPPPVAGEPERIESRIGGPDRVFERPVAEMVPVLQDARQAGPTGRVGYELVFWGYELAGGDRATLVACAILPDVDCEARRARVCESGTAATLFTGEQGGAVRFRNCQAVGIAQPGDLTPNCTETEQTQPIQIHLLRCN